jgi:hypothetical protein
LDDSAEVDEEIEYFAKEPIDLTLTSELTAENLWKMEVLENIKYAKELMKNPNWKESLK